MQLKIPTGVHRKEKVNAHDAIQYVEYVVNPKTLEAYNETMKQFQEQGTVDGQGKGQEMLLFHGMLITFSRTT